MELVVRQTEVDLSRLSGHHSTFRLVSTTSHLNSLKYSCCPETYMDVTYHFMFERHAHYSTHLFIAPSVVICLLIPVVFILPPESSAKISFGVYSIH